MSDLDVLSAFVTEGYVARDLRITGPTGLQSEFVRFDVCVKATGQLRIAKKCSLRYAGQLGECVIGYDALLGQHALSRQFTSPPSFDTFTRNGFSCDETTTRTECQCLRVSSD